MRSPGEQTLRCWRAFGLGTALCAIFALLPPNARAASVEYKRIAVDAVQGGVQARLPLTDVTGPARVKRLEDGGVGIPLAPTHTMLDAACYIEWQISYDTIDPQHWSAVPAIKFEHGDRTKYGCELSKLLAEARKAGLIADSELRAVRSELTTLREHTLEETEKMVVSPDAPAGSAPALPEGFARYVERVPIFQKRTAHGRIEIQLKQKQRAVGFQAMVYACISLGEWRRADGRARGEGAAHSKETVFIGFTKENAGFLLDLVRAFGMASRDHNDDIAKILDAILKL